WDASVFQIFCAPTPGFRPSGKRSRECRTSKEKHGTSEIPRLISSTTNSFFGAPTTASGNDDSARMLIGVGMWAGRLLSKGYHYSFATVIARLKSRRINRADASTRSNNPATTGKENS